MIDDSSVAASPVKGPSSLVRDSDVNQSRAAFEDPAVAGSNMIRSLLPPPASHPPCGKCSHRLVREAQVHNVGESDGFPSK